MPPHVGSAVKVAVLPARRVLGVAWLWRYENAAGAEVEAEGFPVESFPTQADAETRVGETWRELLEAGVQQVMLLEDGREVYGPMPLQE
jgi:hypothetical protein